MDKGAVPWYKSLYCPFRYHITGRVAELLMRVAFSFSALLVAFGAGFEARETDAVELSTFLSGSR